jgi:hypothetical protein
VPSYLSTDMRRGLLTILQASPELGAWVAPNGVPASTAQALVRRKLAEVDGSRITLTEGGRTLAESIRAEHRRLLDAALADEDDDEPRAPHGLMTQAQAVDAAAQALSEREVQE